MKINCAIGLYLIIFCGANAACPENSTCPGINDSFFSCNSGFYKSGTATCLPCPSSGQSDLGAISRTECYSYKAGQTFSDESGAGIFTGTCYFVNDWSAGNYVVLITNIGSDKLNVIKEIRDISGIGLQESKNLVDSVSDTLSQTVIDKISYTAATEIKTRLESLGASITIYATGNYKVCITSAGTSSVNIIKKISELYGTSLSSAKNLVDNASSSTPQTLVSGLSYEYATELKNYWENLGASCVIK